MSTQHTSVVKLHRVGMALALVAGATLPVSTALGAELTDLNGRWTFAETKEEAATKKKAIEDAVASFPRFVRGRAKARLSEQSKPPSDLEIAINGKKVRLGRAGRILELELGGAPKVVSRDGKNAKMSASQDGESLIVKTEGDGGGTRTATYRPTGDGHLRLGIRIEGGKLDQPLAFEQTYAAAK